MAQEKQPSSILVLRSRSTCHPFTIDCGPSGRNIIHWETRCMRLFIKIHDNLVAYFQDMEPPKSSSILRKSSDIRKPIRCVKFTKSVVRHDNIRDQNPSLGMICPGEPHQRNPNAPKFEDRSQEETEWQEQGAREAAWRLAKSVSKIQGEKQRSIFLTIGK